MQQTDVTEREREATRDDVYFDILEFAENNFNTHERTPEGTIIATLTRKGRKSVDLVPKYEMITYYRGNSIQTSHIHMYDPENVTIACNIFKVIFVFARNERMSFSFFFIEKQNKTYFCGKNRNYANTHEAN